MKKTHEPKIPLQGDCFQRLIIRCVEMEISAHEIYNKFDEIGWTIELPNFTNLLLDVIGHPGEQVDPETGEPVWCRDYFSNLFFEFTSKPRSEKQIIKFSKMVRKTIQKHVIHRLAEEKGIL